MVGDGVVVGPGIVSFGGTGGAIDEVFDRSASPRPDIEGEPTAEWLEVRVESPGSQPVSVRREVFDRIGPAARAEGKVPATLAPAELVALEPGMPGDFLPAQTSHWLTIETGVAPPMRVAQGQVDAAAPSPLAAPVQVFHAVRDAVAASIAEEVGGRHYLDAPNIVSLTATQDLVDGDLEIRPVVDIWHRSIALIPLGEPDAHQMLAPGVVAHVAERIIGAEADTATGARPDERAPSVGALFEAARAQAIPSLVLSTPAELAGRPFAADASARLAAALEAGWVAVMPERAVRMGGQERLGWWLVDPMTGRTTDQLDDGRGISMLDEATVVIRRVKDVPPYRRLGCVVAAMFLGANAAVYGIAAGRLAVGGGRSAGLAAIVGAGGSSVALPTMVAACA
jgi:hypothetical protein